MLRLLNMWRALLDRRWVSGGLASLICLAGLWYYAKFVGKIYPIDLWLFWTLAKLWWWMAVLSVACLCIGSRIYDRFIRIELPALETLVHCMAIGLMAFIISMYVAGALALYGPVWAVVLPTAFIAGGATSGLRLGKRVWLWLGEPRPSSLWVWLVSALGACCVGWAYLGLLTPDAINYDAAWYHQVIPQDFAREGRIFKHLGNYNMGVPHGATMIHTWGYTVPGLAKPAMRWMMALHNEFGLFCWTLVGIAAAVRKLLDDQEVRATWVGFFLFPIIFVYDNNMGGAADHIAAFFVVPFLLATLELWKSMSPRAAALLAVPAAGAVLVKYQPLYLYVPLGALLAARWLLLAWRIRRDKLRPEDPQLAWREMIQTPLVLVGLGILLVSPHFIKNAILFHNPFYPFAQETFTGSDPRAESSVPLIRYIFTDDNWRPKGTSIEKLKHAIELLFTFSLEPHYSFSKNVPSFGSLFTLLVPALLVLRKSAKLWVATALAYGAVFIWAYTYNLDRNLQIFLPIMVCVTVGIIVRVWRIGWAARVGLVPLVALQLVWGGDALFYSSFDRVVSSMNLIRSGYNGTAARRFDGFRSEFLAISEALPKNARLLLHTTHLSLGIQRDVVMDWDAFQGYISYDGLSTERELYDYYRAKGITHFLYEPRARSACTKQEEVLFDGLLSSYAKPIGRYGGFALYELGKQAPPPEQPYQVVTIGVSGYASGLYPIKALNTHEYLPGYVQRFAAPTQPWPQDAAARAAMVAGANAVIVSTGARLQAGVEEALKRDFSRVMRYEGYFSVYVRGTSRNAL